jgi:hypothetical protein
MPAIVVVGGVATISLSLLIGLGILVLAIGILIGLAIGHWLWKPDASKREELATWSIELALRPQDQLDPATSGYTIRDNDTFKAFVFATIHGIPGKQPLQGVPVTFAVSSGAVTMQPTGGAVVTGTDGLATIDVTPASKGAITVTATAVVDGTSLATLPSPSYPVVY